MMHGGTFRLDIDHLAATADLTGDNKADMVSVISVTDKKGRASATVTVQAGTGKGLFIIRSSRAVSGAVDAVVTGDFNGDTKADVALLAADKAGNVSVRILAGDGSGRLAAPGPAQSLGQFPLANVAAGHLNGDGRADLMTFDATTGNVTFALAAAVGTTLLPAVQQFNPFGDVTPVGFGDVDNDGRLDLLGATVDQLLWNKWVPLTGQFNSTSLATLATSLDLDGRRLEFADVTGDGANDLIAIAADGSVGVAAGNPLGFGEFGAWTSQTFAGLNPNSVAVGDVNGDGRADLFKVADLGIISVARLVLLGGTDGLFQKLKF